MKVLVTGAGGFIGANVVRAFRRGGYEVVALVREETCPLALQGLDIELRRGDVRDPDSLDRAMQGCQAAVHVAALYELSGYRPHDYYETNVDGTRNLIEAARRAGVERIIHTSSIATIQPRTDRIPADESSFLPLERAPGPYERSKIIAERLALSAAAQSAPVVILNPTATFGPWDTRPTPTGRIIVDFCQGRMPMYVQTGLNVVAVEDVAEAYVTALERGRSGERYILGGTNMALADILALVASLTGRAAPRWRLPLALAYAVALLDDGLLRKFRGGPARVPLAGVRLARHWMYFDSAKAVAELALRQSSPRIAFEKAIAWFREHRYI